MAKKSELGDTKFYFILAVALFVLAAWHFVDGWIPPARWLDRYPDFPEAWHDFGLYEFYAYNRYTAVMLGVGAVVCAAISAYSHWSAKREDDLLSDLAQIRRQRK